MSNEGGKTGRLEKAREKYLLVNGYKLALIECELVPTRSAGLILWEGHLFILIPRIGFA